MNNKMDLYKINLKDHFEFICGLYPENTALAYLEQSENITYKQLDEKSNQLARFLLSQGVQKTDVIAIINTKQAVSFCLMMACLKIGVIYTNIDDDNPLVRTANIIDTCRPKLLFADAVVDDELTQYLEQHNIDFVSLKSIELSLYSNAFIDIYPAIDSNNPAYIMFTSGSTGKPKGVVVTHQNVLNFIHWGIKRFAITDSDVFANVSPIYFDNSVFDFYLGLFSGATLAPIPKSVTKSPLELVELIDKLACTIWFSVPTLLIYLYSFKVLTADRFSSIRVISFGGEGFPKKTLQKIYDRFSDRIAFINVYGPTEGTCICSSYDVSDSDFDELSGILPLGLINQNFDFKIIDNDGKVLPPGKQGELCLLGPNLALGYYNDIEKTKTAFVANPEQNNYVEKMYKTGDLVYQDELSHLLFFVARKDNQIKHMGYRIELDEIDQACLALPYVNHAVTIYKRINDNFGKIFAYIVTENNFEDENVIINDLADYLPDYMVPSEIIFLSDLPKNANGKIDRTQL